MRPMTRFVAFSIALGAAASIDLAASPARAQSGAEEKAAAEALFDQGKKLFLDKNFAEACPRFEASQKLDPGIGTLLFLADCYESVGRVASAWATFREAASAAKASGQADRERIARGRAGLLEPKLFRLTLTFTGDAPGLRVKRNEAELRRELIGAPVPVDPGAHTITVSATGKKPWTTRIDVPAGPGERTVAIPPLEDAPAAPGGEPKETKKDPAPEPPAEPPKGMSSQRIAGFVMGGVGVGGVVLGSIFGAQAFSKNSDAKKLCVGVRCKSQEGVDAITGARTAADLSTGMFIAGGALVAGGLILIFTAPSSRPKEPSKGAWIAPVVGPGTAGFAAGRSF